MRKPLSTVCFELSRHAAEAEHPLLAYILRLAAGEALNKRIEVPATINTFVGVFDWDVPNDLCHTDRMGSEAFNVDPVEAAKGLPIGAFLESLHPDDLSGFNASLQKTLCEGGHFYEEYRLVHGNQIKWIAAQGFATLDHSRRPLRFPGVIFDITQQKATPSPIRRSMSLN